MAWPFDTVSGMRVPSLPLRSNVLVYLVVPFVLLALLLFFTYCYTTLRFQLAARARQRRTSTSSSERESKAEPLPAEPPLSLPYTIPFLGHAFTFLQTQPGRFFEILRPSSPDSRIGSYNLPSWVQSVRLYLAGQETNLTWDPTTITALFKKRDLARHKANVQVLHNLFGMPISEVDKFYGKDLTAKGEEEVICHNWLLEKDAVANLTVNFVSLLKQRLEFDDEHKLQSVNGITDGKIWKDIDGVYYNWLRPILFEASTTSFFGSDLFDSYAQTSGQPHPHPIDRDAFACDFFNFDTNFLSMFFGLPRLFSPGGWAERDRLKRAFAAWGQKWINAKANVDLVVQS